MQEDHLAPDERPAGSQAGSEIQQRGPGRTLLAGQLRQCHMNPAGIHGSGAVKATAMSCSRACGEIARSKATAAVGA